MNWEKLIQENRPLVIMGTINAYSALLAERAGIKAKIIGSQARENYWAVRAQQRRYGKVLRDRPDEKDEFN